MNTGQALGYEEQQQSPRTIKGADEAFSIIDFSPHTRFLWVYISLPHQEKVTMWDKDAKCT